MAPSPAAEMVEEAEGLRLHLSSKSSTGYKGVSYAPLAALKPYSCKASRTSEYLGTFATAVEAAVCYARNEQSQQEAAEGVVEAAAARPPQASAPPPRVVPPPHGPTPPPRAAPPRAAQPAPRVTPPPSRAAQSPPQPAPPPQQPAPPSAKPPALSPGQLVRISGLSQRAELNGRTAIVVQWEGGDLRRYTVELAAPFTNGLGRVVRKLKLHPGNVAAAPG